MARYIALYIALLCSLAGRAQYLSAGGDFSIDQRRGCRDLLVTVTNINPGSGVILYQYEGKNAPVVADTFYTYSTAGSFWLYQYIQGPTGQKADSILVEVLDPMVPQFDLQTCNGNGVQVSINDSYYDLYEIDYGDGTVIQVPVNTFPPLYTYASNAGVAVTVTGLFATASNRCGTDSRAFTPLAQVVPGSIDRLEVLDGQTLVISYTQAVNTVSTLEVAVNGNSNFQLYANLSPGSTTDTLRNLLPGTAVYCFRLVSHDACSNFKAYSPEICTAFARIQPVNNALELNWQTYYPAGVSAPEIWRDSTLLATLSGSPLAYSDSTVQCNNTYCYTLRIRYSNGAESMSNRVCATAYSTDIPAPVVNAVSRHQGNRIDWQWPTPANETVQYFTMYSSAGQVLDTTYVNTYTATVKNDDNCLFISFVNACQAEAPPSPLFCPLELQHRLAPDGTVSLSWNSYNGYANGVSSYRMAIYDSSLNLLDSIDTGTGTTYDHPLPAGNEQVNFYRVWALPSDSGLTASHSLLLRVERPPIIGIPNSFTPNGDNINDLFIITGKYIQAVDLYIFNRWGNLIYHSRSNAWDGTSQGHKVPLGSYAYRAIIKDFAGNEHIREGTVLILKN